MNPLERSPQQIAESNLSRHLHETLVILAFSRREQGDPIADLREVAENLRSEKGAEFAVNLVRVNAPFIHKASQLEEIPFSKPDPEVVRQQLLGSLEVFFDCDPSQQEVLVKLYQGKIPGQNL